MQVTHIRLTRQLLRIALAASFIFVRALSSQQLPASEIRGVVTDSAGAPISQVRVRLTAAGREDVTRDDGGFTLRAVPAGTHMLTAIRVGFHPVTQAVIVGGATAASIRVVMTPTLVQLSTMVVTGTAGARDASEVLRPITIVDAEQLARKLAASIAATIQNEPGVSMSGMGPATARVVIRGLSGDRVVMLEDGSRPGDLSSTSPDHAVAIDPLTAGHFEVVRGPMSLLYGSSALGGVVNVIREEIPVSTSSGIHGMLSAEGSTVNGGATVGGSATASVGNVALRAEGSVRNASNLRTPLGTLGNTELLNYGFSAGASLIYPSGHTGASYRYFSNTYGVPGGFVGGHASGVDIDMYRHSFKAESERHPVSGPFASLKASAAFTNYHHGELQPDGDVATSFDQQILAIDLIARHDQLGIFSNGAIGLHAQNRDVTTLGALRTPSTADNSIGAFLVEEWEHGFLHLQGGIRYDWAHYAPHDADASVEVGGVLIPADPRSFGSASGSLGVLLHASEALQFGASASRAFRTPDFNELYSDGPHLAAFSYDDDFGPFQVPVTVQ